MSTIDTRTTNCLIDIMGQKTCFKVEQKDSCLGDLFYKPY